jgi:hypothetical protein
MGWRVAQEIAMPMSVNPDMMNNARQMYEAMASRAAEHALNEVKQDKDPESEFITGRR